MVAKREETMVGIEKETTWKSGFLFLFYCPVSGLFLASSTKFDLSAVVHSINLQH